MRRRCSLEGNARTLSFCIIVCSFEGNIPSQFQQQFPKELGDFPRPNLGQDLSFWTEQFKMATQSVLLLLFTSDLTSLTYHISDVLLRVIIFFYPMCLIFENYIPSKMRQFCKYCCIPWSADCMLRQMKELTKQTTVSLLSSSWTYWLAVFSSLSLICQATNT